MNGTVTAQKSPDARGRFGAYGGRYVPETLMAPLEELERAYAEARADAGFQAQVADLLKNFAGRPTPLQFAERLTQHLDGAKIYLKREDLLHTGAHKINNCIGQGLLAKRMGKSRVVAETGAGQHGVAAATVAASARSPPSHKCALPPESQERKCWSCPARRDRNSWSRWCGSGPRQSSSRAGEW